MAPFRILITDGLEENGKAILRGAAEVTDKPGITPEELVQVVADFDALIVRGRTKVVPAVFAAGKKLKVVGRAGVGVDNIDLNAAREHKVMVVNAPTATTISVAELTLAMMLAMVRELPRADASMKAGKWLKKEFEGNELAGKTLGIIGIGRIGTSVAKRAAAFDMKVVAYDPRLTAGDIRLIGADPVTLDQLLHLSDVITLHVPLTTDTRGMINAETIGKMKDGVRLVCAARGGVVDEAALLAALESGKVAGAALDVFSTEPPGLTPLVGHPRVIATPHMGAQTVESQIRAAEDISTEVLAALRGEALRWKVA